MLHVIKMWLEAPVEKTDEGGNKPRSTQNRDTGRGTPQGSPISPLLSNLYMRRFVLGWKKLGHEKHLKAYIVNYADDLVICCRGQADEALASIWRMAFRTAGRSPGDPAGAHPDEPQNLCVGLGDPGRRDLVAPGADPRTLPGGGAALADVEFSGPRGVRAGLLGERDRTRLVPGAGRGEPQVGGEGGERTCRPRAADEQPPQ